MQAATANPNAAWHISSSPLAIHRQRLKPGSKRLLDVGHVHVHLQWERRRWACSAALQHEGALRMQTPGRMHTRSGGVAALPAACPTACRTWCCVRWCTELIAIALVCWSLAGMVAQAASLRWCRWQGQHG